MVKDALVSALASARADAASPLHAVDVFDSWPSKGITGRFSVLVLDFEGDERAATMRAGGGTRDDELTLDAAVVVVRKTDDVQAVRAQAQALSDELKRMVRESGHPVFGVPGVRNPRVVSWRVIERIVERGRECDVRLTFGFTARHRLGA